MWVLGGIFAVVLAICVVGAVLAIATNDPNVDVNLGDDEFIIENVEAKAELIADDEPLLFADLATGSRPILVNHIGDDPRTGWVAVLAIAPGSEACVVTWDAEAGGFEDCEGVTYPPDGEGLEQFPTRVEGDKLYIDLGRGRSDEPPPTTESIPITGNG
jgi:hypothetical protein